MKIDKAHRAAMRKMRKALHLAQSELAALAGVSDRFVVRMERGKSVSFITKWYKSVSQASRFAERVCPLIRVVRPGMRTTMGDGELKYPKWEREFQEAVLELDREKLFEQIQKLETAIFVRLQELQSDSDHHSERQAIRDAVSTIRVLKKEKLSTS